MCFCVYERESLGEFRLNFLAKTTLPKSVANLLGNVFVPNGIGNHFAKLFSITVEAVNYIERSLLNYSE